LNHVTRRHTGTVEMPFFTTAVLVPLVARLGPSSNAILEHQNVTYVNTFGFYSCTFRFLLH